MLSFKEKVHSIVRQIPYGKVASYGQIALMMGIPRAARQVGWVMAHIKEEHKLPWWRVVNNKGQISIKNTEYGALEQKEKLENEGIDVINFCLDIKKHRYILTQKEIEKLELSPDYLDKLLRFV